MEAGHKNIAAEISETTALNQRKPIRPAVVLTASANEPSADPTLLESPAEGATSLSTRPEVQLMDKLAAIVGDPQAKEASWMNACVAAGGRSLVQKPPLRRRIAQTLWAAFTIGLCFMSAPFLFAATLFLAAYIAALGNVDANTFLTTLKVCDAPGLAAAMCATLALWTSLCTGRKKSRLLGLLASGSLLTLATAGGLSDKLPESVAWFTGFAAALSLLLVDGIGSACRSALPRHFNGKKLAAAIFPAAIFPGLMMCVIIAIMVTRPSGNPQAYESVTAGGFSFMLTCMLATIVPVGVAIARASKTTSASACALLSAVSQLPLLVGLALALLGAFLATICSGDPQWIAGGPVEIASLCAVMVLTLGAAAGGGWIGAQWNRKSLKQTPKST